MYFVVIVSPPRLIGLLATVLSVAAIRKQITKIVKRHDADQWVSRAD
jgi:hypothetical protein